MFNTNVFTTPEIPESTQIIFVSDLFVEDYIGGAELTSESLITSSPFEVYKLHSKDVTMALLARGANKFWVFGNFTQINPQLIPSIVGNLKYSIVEYDYKYCKFRSPEKHRHSTGSDCDCHNEINGKLISAFYYGSMGLWWMSEKQKEKYFSMFPFLAEKDNVVLSSVFDNLTLSSMKLLSKQDQSKRKGWICLGSSSWVKGADQAEKWCKDNNLDYEVIWNLPYEETLAKLSKAEGFVYLPAGADTCPRMVIEAKLLGCKLHLNDYVQHKDEEWFTTDSVDEITDYLSASPGLFWKGIRAMMDYKPSISGYTTTYNCIDQQYPFEECIQSMLEFCDEVCVVDGGSMDGTYEVLLRLAAEYVTQNNVKDGPQCKLKVKQVKRDWNHPRFAVFDGMQKAEARAMCTKDFCWQMDSDEIVHEDDAQKIHHLCRSLSKDIDIVSLPVIEYWGGEDKVRVDIQPWKWRLSRNNPDITHGIPIQLRRQDENGDTFAIGGTDGCDMISRETGECCNHVSFYSQEAENARQAAIQGNLEALKEYENWFNGAVNNLPGVFHYSWYDLSRKIKLYKSYWTKHWNSLMNKNIEDTAETNMMFDLPWSSVTDEMIDARAQELKLTGGHIWHQKWNGKKIPWMTCNRKQPKYMVKK